LNLRGLEKTRGGSERQGNRPPFRRVAACDLREIWAVTCNGCAEKDKWLKKGLTVSHSKGAPGS